MRMSLRILLLPALLIITALISRANGAAVMSVDLGTEWMKV